MPRTPVRKSSPKGSAARGKVATASPSTLLQAQEVAENLPVQREKRGRKRSLDEIVTKCISDNFKSMSEVQTDLTIIDGVSLRQRLRADKSVQNADASKIKMGKLYYDKLRLLYASSSSPEQLLRVLDEREPVPSALMDACAAALSHRRNLSPLVEFMQRCTTMNQKSVVGLYRTLLRLSPSVSVLITEMLMDAMAMVRRMDLQSKFPAEFQHVRKHFDATLVKSLAAFKQHGQSAQLRWDSSRPCAALLLPEVAVDACVQCRTTWADVATELASVIQSSDVGKRLFASAWRDLQCARVRAAIDSIVKHLEEVHVIDESAVQRGRKAFKQKLEELGASGNDASTRREVSVSYRGIEIRLLVASVMDEYNVAEETFLRQVAVESGGLCKLWCEDAFVQARRPCVQSVDLALVTRVERARQAAQSFLGSTEHASSDGIADVLSRKGAVLSSLDRFFKIEASLFTCMRGERACAKLECDALECLPADGRARTPEESLALLDSLLQGALVAFCGVGMHAVLTSARSFVFELSHNRMPMFDSTSQSPFLARIKEHLARFVSHTVAASVGAASSVLYGVAALQKMLQEVKEARATSLDLISFAILQSLHVYGWLLDETDWKLVATLTNEVVNSHVVVAGPSALPSRRRAVPKSSADGPGSLVAALFQ